MDVSVSAEKLLAKIAEQAVRLVHQELQIAAMAEVIDHQAARIVHMALTEPAPPSAAPSPAASR